MSNGGSRTVMPPGGLPKPFQIGLKPLEVAEWIAVDGQLAAYLDEKERLEATVPEKVFVMEPGTEAAQAEVLALLASHLPQRFPEIYQRDGTAMDIVPASRRVLLDAAGTPALLLAARLVQEDLVLMRKGATGWRLVAASLSFPSSWVLAEKFGRPMHEVHGPVPGFGGGSRNAAMIERIFDNARSETPMLRWNWSLFGDARLFHPEAGHPDQPRFGPEGEHVYLRAERQTLRKLPESGDMLFTIRIYLDHLEALTQHPDAAPIAAVLAEQLAAMSDEQAGYKGLLRDRALLLARLGTIARA